MVQTATTEMPLNSVTQKMENFQTRIAYATDWNGQGKLLRRHMDSNLWPFDCRSDALSTAPLFQVATTTTTNARGGPTTGHATKTGFGCSWIAIYRVGAPRASKSRLKNQGAFGGD